MELTMLRRRRKGWEKRVENMTHWPRRTWEPEEAYIPA